MTIRQFRRATADDLPALKNLVESAYRGDLARGGWTHEADLLTGERISLDELASTLADPKQQIIVALDNLAQSNGSLCACVVISDLGIIEDRRRAYLGMLAVAPWAQASGLGRALIAEAEERARASFGACLMEMTVITARKELIAWYERRGYTRTNMVRPFPTLEGSGLEMAVLERSLTIDV